MLSGWKDRHSATATPDLHKPVVKHKGVMPVPDGAHYAFIIQL
jgi:hypothetical protein